MPKPLTAPPPIAAPTATGPWNTALIQFPGGALGTVAAAQTGIASGSIIQLPPGVPAPPLALMQTPVGPQWVPLGGAQSPAQLVQTAQPRPRFEDLFETISDPDEVAKELFHTEGTPTLVPYEVEYVKGREGMGDVQAALYTALAEGGGRLLVAGRAGIGKTREIAELARNLCGRRWKICVARAGADARFGAVPALPPALLDARLLFIIDNLHARLSPVEDQPVPYPDRLEAFLESVEALAPGDVRAIAITRGEPRFGRLLGFSGAATRWRSFGLFRMPDFTLEGLRKMLANLAGRAQVQIAEEDVAKLVEDSDRKPETLFINVDLARQKGLPLTRADWLPTEGDSWREKSLAAHARYPAAEKVYQALRLLRAARLPTRIGYVARLSSAFDGDDTLPAIEGLVDRGLLGLRQNLLTLFSAEQLETTENAAGPPQILPEHWDSLVQVLTDSSEPPPEWREDLADLAFSLTRANLPARGAGVASLAISRGADTSDIFLARGAGYFLSGKLREAAEDLSSVLERDEKNGNAHHLRGVARNLLGNFGGVVADAERAIALGCDNQNVQVLLGMGHYNQGQWREAEAAFTEAIKHGNDDGSTFFVRGTARYQLGDFVGAEADLSAVLDRGMSMDQSINLLAALERGDPKAFAALDQPAPRPREDDALPFALRGAVRLAQRKFPEAETDFSEALARGFGQIFTRLSDVIHSTSLPGLSHAKEQIARAQATIKDAGLFPLRARARMEQAKWEEALADLQQALEQGAIATEVYCMRAEIFYRMNRLTEAEAELNLAVELGRDDAEVFRWRGLVRQQAGRLAEADADLTTALTKGDIRGPTLLMRAAGRLDLGRAADAEQDCNEGLLRKLDPTLAYTLRGGARLNLGRFEESEADLDHAIELGRNDFLVFRWRGLARWQRSKLSDTEADLTTAIDRGDVDGQSFAIRAAVRLDLQRATEAEQDCDAALQRGADQVLVHSVRGLARLDLGRPPGAEADFQRAIDLGRQDHFIFKGRGLARLRQDKFPEAEADFTASINAGSNDADTFVDRARSRLSQQNWSGTEADLLAAQARGRDDADLQFMLGLARRGLNQYAAAEQAFTAALAQDGINRAFLYERGLTRLLWGKFAEAEQDFDQFLGQVPGDAAARGFRALARYGRGELAAAVEDYSAALAAGSTEMSLRVFRTQALLRLGRFDEAEQNCAAVVQAGADTPEALACQGGLLLARGDFGPANARFEDARRAAHDKDWHFALGLTLLLDGRTDAALAAYQRGTAESLPADLKIGLNDLEFWLQQFPDRAARADIQETAGIIRAILARKIEMSNLEIAQAKP